LGVYYFLRRKFGERGREGEREWEKESGREMGEKIRRGVREFLLIRALFYVVRL
jgi:hypothetical protein